MNKLLKEGLILVSLVTIGGALASCARGDQQPVPPQDPKLGALVEGFSSIPTSTLPVRLMSALPSPINPPHVDENSMGIFLTGANLPQCSYDLALDATTDQETTTFTTNGVTRSPDEFFVRTSEGKLLKLPTVFDALDAEAWRHHMVLLAECPFLKDTRNKVAAGTKFDLVATGFMSTTEGLKLVDPHRFVATVNQTQ